MTATQIELKNVKYHDDMSQETPCFSATLYVDGKRAAIVRNEGMGGCCFYDGIDPSFDERALNEKVAAETGETFEPLDQVVLSALEDTLVRREVKRIVKSKWVWIENGQLWSAPKGKNKNVDPKVAEDAYRKRRPDITVFLNAVSEEEAVAAYRSAA